MANIDAGLVRGPQGPRGIKGDPFTYADFTESQIAELQRPATEAAVLADKATKDAQAAIADVKATEAKLYPVAENTLKGKAKETFVHVDDAFPSSLLGIEIEGACRQDGTPSPDNPVPIEVIENPVVQVRGKNFWDKGIIGYNYSKDYIKYNAEASIKMEPGTYTVSSDGRLPYIQFFEPDSHKQITCAEAIDGVGSGVKYSIFWNGYCISPPGDASRAFSITLTRQVEMTMCVEPDNHGTWIQIERGTDATAYAPYVGTSQAFTLPTEHPYLAKLPDGTADEIVVDKDGNVELVARVTRNTLTSWNNTAAGYFTCAISPHRADNFVLCNGGVKMHGRPEGEVFVGSALNIVAYQPREGDTTDALNAKGLLLYYKLVTPNRYPLGKIEMPKAQDSIINVWTDAEVTPRTGIEYTRDVNIVVANIESAIASIS